MCTFELSKFAIPQHLSLHTHMIQEKTEDLFFKQNLKVLNNIFVFMNSRTYTLVSSMCQTTLDNYLQKEIYYNYIISNKISNSKMIS